MTTRLAYPADERPWCQLCMNGGSAVRSVAKVGPCYLPVCGHHKRQRNQLTTHPYTITEPKEGPAMTTTTVPTIPATAQLQALPVRTGLRPLAKAHGVTYTAKTTKAELVAALAAHRGPDGPGGPSDEDVAEALANLKAELESPEAQAVIAADVPDTAPAPAPAKRGKGRDLGDILRAACPADGTITFLQDVAKAHGVSVGALTNRWKANATDGIVASYDGETGRKGFARKL